MLEQVRHTISRHGMIHRGDLVIVAVSGGPDSVAMLHALVQLAPEYGASLHVFHLDHGLRGEESEEDALYVRRLAASLGLPSTIVGLGPDVLKRRSGSLQANARAVRYEEISALAARIGANKVAVGQNRNDQAETVLMRLMRGAGVQGLAGIQPVRSQGNLTFIRPLLYVSRKEIETYCRTHELSPRLDASNLRPDYLRNRIRLDLLPKLVREYNPAIVENLAHMAAVLRDEDALLDGLAREALERCRIPGEGTAFSGNVLRAEPVAVSRRVVRLLVKEVAGPEVELGLPAVTQVLELVGRVEGTHLLDLPGSIRLVAEYGVCRFFAAEENSGRSPQSEWPIALIGTTEISELGLCVHVSSDTVPLGPDRVSFDLERLAGPLAIRFRRPGDRIWPVGMEGSKKLQDILVDAKVPQRLRDRVPLLVAGDDVLWVLGHRIDRRYLATCETTQVLTVQIREHALRS